MYYYYIFGTNIKSIRNVSTSILKQIRTSIIINDIIHIIQYLLLLLSIVTHVYSIMIIITFIHII